MKKAKTIRLLILLVVPVLLLSNYESVAECASTQDTRNWVERRRRVIVDLDDSFVPMGFRRKNGELVGYSVDLARAVFKQYGIKVDFQPIDWSVKETKLKNSTIDLSWNGYSVNPSRAKKIAFNRYYLENRQILVIRKKSNIKSLNGMTDEALGVQNGSTRITVLDGKSKLLKDKIKHHTPVLYDTFPNAPINLDTNRIQGILMDEVYADYYIKHQPNSNSYRAYISKELPMGHFAVGMRKGDKTLKKKINQGLGNLQKNGELRRLNKK